MNLLTYLLRATRLWSWVFPQERSLQRAITLAFGILCGVGRRTITRAIAAPQGREALLAREWGT